MTGPVNTAKDGIAPLSAVVETDWLPYSFSMSWRFTRPDHRVRLRGGRALLQLLPFRAATWEPSARSCATSAKHRRWSGRPREWAGARDRATRPPGDEAAADPARGHGRYREGPSGPDAVPDHETRLRLHPFVARGAAAGAR